jgi:hypothetical protein
LTKNNMTLVPHPPHLSLFPRLKKKLKGRHFDASKVIRAESWAMLNTLTEYYFQRPKISFDHMAALIPEIMGTNTVLQSVLNAQGTLRTTGHICITFNIWEFNETLLRLTSFCLDRAPLATALQECLDAFLLTSIIQFLRQILQFSRRLSLEGGMI